MTTSVSNVNQNPAPAIPRPPAAAAKAPPTPIAADTVQISAAAQALQEATEAPAQTAREAASGDVQAKHLLARQAAARVAG